MKVFFAGDLVGSPGRSVLAAALPALSARWQGFDFVVVNCENAAAGKGMTGKVMQELFDLGVHAMTSGNHIWDKNVFYPTLNEEGRVLRPANYPSGCPGSGSALLERNGKKLGLLNLQGRVFMPAIDCPFRAADEALKTLGDVPILLDFHAEATSEKKALALYLDGRVSALLGTHTHVQTADEQILPGGTAYISDVGMTGGHGGIIGVKPESVLSRYLTAMPAKFEVSEDDPRLNAVVVNIDEETGRVWDIVRVNERVDLG